MQGAMSHLNLYPLLILFGLDLKSKNKIQLIKLVLNVKCKEKHFDSIQNASLTNSIHFITKGNVVFSVKIPLSRGQCPTNGFTNVFLYLTRGIKALNVFVTMSGHGAWFRQEQGWGTKRKPCGSGQQCCLGICAVPRAMPFLEIDKILKLDFHVREYP